jgi:Tfp pilus assembly PilM family ATPase
MWLEHVGLEQAPELIEGDPDTVGKARAAIENGASALLDELRLSLDFYGAQEAAVPVERVVLCGPGSAIPGLGAHMEPVLGLPIVVGRPEALDGLDPAAAARLTLPFGLALDR